MRGARSSNATPPESAGLVLELDGDGTHAWVESLYDPDLEGTHLVARGRRRAEAAARAAEDDDYYE